ncbi:MAG: zinc ribbon domain-containing protein [Desulfobacterales bacterium]|nr:zinc ribbon domain-containing protein [Desulfobacterales bacterium]
MPIYEFYCKDCHTIFNFYSKTIDTKKVPICPKCRKTKLTRKISLFAVTGRAEEGGDEDLPVDEPRMEKAMEWMARQAEHIDEDDPRQAADLMRKFTDMTGVELGSGMQEALRRMEAGEDPEQVEAEMGDALEGEEPFIMPGKKGFKSIKRRLPPQRDETLYEL